MPVFVEVLGPRLGKLIRGFDASKAGSSLFDQSLDEEVP